MVVGKCKDKSITKLTGSNSNESAEIGVIELDWVEDANVDLFELISSVDFDDSNFEACVVQLQDYNSWSIYKAW